MWVHHRGSAVRLLKISRKAKNSFFFLILSQVTIIFFYDRRTSSWQVSFSSTPGIDSYITLRNNKHPLNFTHFVVVSFFSSEKYIGVCEEDVVLLLFRLDLVVRNVKVLFQVALSGAKDSFITEVVETLSNKITINYVEKY